MTLFSFLDPKPLSYDEIDYERMPRTYRRIASHFKLPRIVHVVGTNGKGTTGRFLAQMLRHNGFRVGHYTSPHILRFNERIWIDGGDVQDAILEAYHQKLLSWLDAHEAQALSYFEYTTLLAMAIFCDFCDEVVLEAGLGGEFDATNVFPKILSIVTPIGYDHQDFLGDTIEAIATTKLNSIANDFVLAAQYEASVEVLARQKAQSLHVTMVQPHFDAKTSYMLESYVSSYTNAPFLINNFKTAFCALTFLGYDITFESFSITMLQGRHQKILPNVTLDVGHNVMAALALTQSFEGKKVGLIYNCYKDKDYRAILKLLAPIIEEIYVIAIQSPRAVDEALLYETAKEYGLKISSFQAIDPQKEYVVFGSFSVAEAFVKGIK